MESPNLPPTNPSPQQPVSGVSESASVTAPRPPTREQLWTHLEQRLSQIHSETRRNLKGLRDEVLAKATLLRQKKEVWLQYDPDITADAPSSPNAEIDQLVERLIELVELACATRQSRVAELALDVALLLIANGYVDNTLSAPIVDGMKKAFDMYSEDSVRVLIARTLENAVVVPRCSLHGSLLMDSFRTVYNVYLCSSSKPMLDATMESLLRLLRAVCGRLRSPALSDSAAAELASADVQLLFRALCKLASRDFATRLEPIELRSKRLALDLLKDIFDRFSPVLRAQPAALQRMVHRYIFRVFLANAESRDHKLFRTVLQIFLHVLSYFKNMKVGIAAAFRALVLRNLSRDPSTSPDVRRSVLQVLLQIFQHQQMIVDIFANYDCEPDLVNVIEDAVVGLGSVMRAFAPLRSAALACMETLLRSIAERVDNAAGGAEVVDGEMDIAERRKMRKRTIVAGIELFNKEGGKKAIPFLVENGVLMHSPASAALFLREHAGELDESKVGEYLDPKKGEFNSELLTAYLRTFSFRGVPIDIAMRQFMFGFRPAGEAQILDRLLERFSQVYIEENPGSDFVKTDSAFWFSFSIMQLATTQHNPMAVQFRFTLESWKANNHHVCEQFGEPDFRDELQAAVFERVNAHPLRTMAQSRAVPDSLNAWQDSLIGPTVAIAEAESRQLQQGDDANSVTQYRRCTSPTIARLLFQTVWSPLLSAVSDALNAERDPVVIGHCLSSYRHAIHISCAFHLAAERSAFVASLSSVAQVPVLLDMRLRNVETIRTLIGIACRESANLETSWKDVFSTLSVLDRIGAIELAHHAEDAQADPSSSLPASGAAAPSTLLSASSSTLGSAAAAQVSPNVGSLAASSSYGAPAVSRPAASTPALAQSGANPATLPASISSGALVGAQHSSGDAALEEEAQLLNRLGRELREINLECVFPLSRTLDDVVLVEYVDALSRTACDEVSAATGNDRDQLRFYSLHHLIEVVSRENAFRLERVWESVWEHLSVVFDAVGESVHEAVVKFGLSKLLHLSVKMLDAELPASFLFQSDLLSSFYSILAGHSLAMVPPSETVVYKKNVDVREMVVECVKNLILSRGARLLSGWKYVFKIVQSTARDPVEKLIKLSYESMVPVYTDRALFTAVVAAGCFVLCIETTVSLARCRPTVRDVNVPSIEFIGQGAAALDADILHRQQYVGDNYAHITPWITILGGLAEVAGHSHIDVRTAALHKLFVLLDRYGEQFTASFWKKIFDAVLFPLFFVVNACKKMECVNDEEWVITTCLNAVQSLVSMYSKFFAVAGFLLPDLFDLFGRFILSQNMTLAEIGCTSLLGLLTVSGSRLSTEQWLLTAQLFRALMMRMLPLEVFFVALQPPAGIDTATPPRSAAQIARAPSRASSGALRQSGEGSGRRPGRRPVADGATPPRVAERPKQEPLQKRANPLPAGEDSNADLLAEPDSSAAADTSTSVVAETDQSAATEASDADAAIAGIAEPEGAVTAAGLMGPQTSKCAVVLARYVESIELAEEEARVRDDVVFRLLQFSARKPVYSVTQRPAPHTWMSAYAVKQTPAYVLDHVKNRSLVFLHLMNALSTVLIQHVSMLAPDTIEMMLDAIAAGTSFAYIANNDAVVRRAVGKTGLMRSLINVEITCTTVDLQNLFALLNDDATERVDLARPRLIESLGLVLHDHVANLLHSRTQYADMKVPLLEKALVSLAAVQDYDRFEAVRRPYYDLLVDLVASNREAVRRALIPVLKRRGPE